MQKPFERRIIALVYDFDGTLSPDAMQNHGLLPFLGFGIDFWQEVKAVKAANDAVEILTYMNIVLHKMRQRSDIDWPTRLRELGTDVPLFPGVESWFTNIDALVSKLSQGRIVARHYVLSSGLAEMIAGNPVSKHLKKTFASSFMWDGQIPTGVARAITDASKPQYIFRINKGREDYSQDINEHMEEGDRPIPFSHILFIGDGDTDVPCMTVTSKNGGHALAVFDPAKGSGVEKCKRLYEAERVRFYAPADYQRGSPLWVRTEIILKKMVADIRLEWADHLFRTRVVNRYNNTNKNDVH